MFMTSSLTSCGPTPAPNLAGLGLGTGSGFDGCWSTERCPDVLVRYVGGAKGGNGSRSEGDGDLEVVHCRYRQDSYNQLYEIYLDGSCLNLTPKRILTSK